MTIANGESGSSVRAKLNAGLCFIASGTIVDDTTIALPAGFSIYEMHLLGLEISADGNYSVRVSSDGGSTYWDGATDYVSTNVHQFTADFSTTSDQGFLGYPRQLSGTPAKTDLKLTIRPGASASFNPTALTTIEVAGVIRPAGFSIPEPIHTSVALPNQPSGPINAIKFKPLWGDARVTTAGTYRLLGIA